MDQSVVNETVATERALAVRAVPMLPVEMQEMSIEQVVLRVEKVRELQKRVMKEGAHYGVIPGTPKPTLLKPGAEVLCLTFMLDPQYEHDIKQDGQHREITSRCVLYHIPSGRRVASGEGSCSTFEAKYAYRKSAPLCLDCGKELRVSKDKASYYCWWKTGGCSATFLIKDPRIKPAGRVANPDLADQWNTVLKMANKRALVAAVLNATGASEIYTQDLEDLVEREEHDDPDMKDRGASGAAETRAPEGGAPIAKQPARRPPVALHPSEQVESFLPEDATPAPEAAPRLPRPQVAAPPPPATKVVATPEVATTAPTPDRPISEGQINLLLAVLRGAKLIQNEDALIAIDWLCNHMGWDVEYSDDLSSMANLRALLKRVPASRVTALKNAIQQEGKKE